ncbi:MAG: phosphoribosylformylglycinamidine synthase subunit PurS [Dehalococcoidia bacterium]|nr:phosphoribosylformylglycinamidine synthase subunit PurS [Dehalococcoidia bacterium]MDW8119351.1 phosphoribosylformylglycinamidine synthase subunit PurS [Chloroflexota bacterium]
MEFLVHVLVSLKPTVNDPQGVTVQSALQALGFSGVRRVRVGKYLEVHLQAESLQDAQRQAEEMCRRLLANPVIEQFQFTVREASPAA